MKRRLPLIALCVCLLNTNFSQAQEGGEDLPKNVIKLNLFSLAFTNFSLQYERVLGEKISAGLGFSYLPGVGVPAKFTNDDATLEALKLSGMAITPEFRWYPGSKKPAPKGFYLAPYLRYTNYTITSVFPFKDDTSVPGTTITKEFKMEGTLTGFGGGVMMGVHWLIKDKVSLDWWIVGGHYGAGQIEVKLKDDFTGIEAELESQLKAIEAPIGTTEAVVTSSEATVTVSDMPFAGLRTGLTLGYAF